MNFATMLLFLLACSAYAQTEPLSPGPAPDPGVEELSKRINELAEHTKKNTESLEKQAKDQYFDQNSRGFLEVKFGRASIEPKDIEDENNEVFTDESSANWENFDYANIIDFEIGKTIMSPSEGKHEIGIGYQHLRSKRLQASFTRSASDGGGRAKVFETILVHTLFARYAYLFKSTPNFYFGPGATLGYSPVSKLLIEVEVGNEGAQVYGENTSMLVELFLKGKFEFTRYLYVVGTAGYRMQEADNLRLNAAELVTLKTRTDLDVSGFYGLLGFATSF